MKRITLDSNVLPAEDLLLEAKEGEFEFAVISVTEREMEGTSFLVNLRPLSVVSDTIAFGQGAYGAHAFGGVPSKECCETALAIISNGSFPPPEHRASLSKGQLRQECDALIICTHVRDHRDILVTNDLRGFISNGRRERLQDAFGTTIMTRDEFLESLRVGH